VGELIKGQVILWSLDGMIPSARSRIGAGQ